MEQRRKKQVSREETDGPPCAGVPAAGDAEEAICHIFHMPSSTVPAGQVRKRQAGAGAARRTGRWEAARRHWGRGERRSFPEDVRFAWEKAGAEAAAGAAVRPAAGKAAGKTNTGE